MTDSPALLFRRIQRRDLEARVSALNEASVAEGITIEVPVSREATEAWYEQTRNDSSRRDFVFLAEGEIVGFAGIVGISQQDRRCEAYFFVSARHQGRGFGTDMLRLTLAYMQSELNLRKVSLYVTAGNTGALRFYARHGFVQEACLQAHSWHRGAYHDRMILSHFLDPATASDTNLYGSMS